MRDSDWPVCVNTAAIKRGGGHAPYLPSPASRAVTMLADGVMCHNQTRDVVLGTTSF